jgi:hypothetical protein
MRGAIYVPRGAILDSTRNPAYYDEIYNYLVKCGIPAENH